MAKHSLSRLPSRIDRLALAIVTSLALGGFALTLCGISDAHAGEGWIAGAAAMAMTSASSASHSERYYSPGGHTAGASSSSGDTTAAPTATYALSVLDLPSIGMDDGGGTQMHESDLYLEVFLGDRSTQKIGHFKLRNGLLWATPADLTDLGIVVDPGVVVDSDGMLPLDRLPGLQYHYDVANQRVVLDVPTALRPQQILGYKTPAAVHADRGSGLTLNYDSYASNQNGQTTVSVATALTWFGRAGALELSGLSRAGGSDSIGYQRLDTRWTYSDPNHLWTWTAGDLISGGLSWTRPVRLGGLQWRRNFGVRPDLITYPVPSFASQAAVPSSVQLLVNNVQQFGTQVNDGPFVINNFPQISGAGEATLVVRDALGRVTQTTVQIYSDNQRLAKGLTDFSVEAGVLRHDYASDQDGYSHDPVFSGSLRRGLTDDVTLEAHAESGPHLALAGLGMVWSPFGHWGIVAASAAHSQGNGSGWQRTLGYQFNSRHFGLDLQTQRADRGYRDLGSLQAAGQGPMLKQDRASFWVPLHRGSLAYTWVRWLDAADHHSRIQTLSFSQNIGKWLYLTSSVFHDQATGTGVGLSLSMPFDGDKNAALNVSYNNGLIQTVATVQRSVPYQGGWGWQVQAGDRNGGYGSAVANFRGSYGDASFGIARDSGRISSFLSANGSLAFMDGHWFASRRIGDSFALVSTDGVGKIPILYENRVFGLTDSRGYLMMPDLRGWQRNRLAIDPDRLGANYRLSALEQFVTPADAGGTLVHFVVEKLTPAIVILLGPDGAVVPAGTPGKINNQNVDVLVGFEGETYIEDVTAGSVIQLETSGALCRYHLPAVPASTGQVRLGPLACERSDP